MTDQAGRRTEATYDALGRTTKVWTAGRAGTAKTTSKIAGQAYVADNAAIPNMEYEYHIGEGNAASVVISKTLQSDGSVAVGYELSDGMLRPRQQQEPAPGGGRVITETRYDSRGLAIKQYGAYYNDQPVTETVAEPVEDAIPTKKLISFDGAERPVEETFVSGTTVRWTTKHKNSADQQTVEPPKGQQPTTKVTDSQGRLTELRQFTGTTASGTYDKTSYKYDAAGRPLLITDPAGNKWTWEYDVRGRKVKEIDPDKGTTTFTYNELDQVTSSIDARGSKLEFSYDTIGRRSAVHQVAPTGAKTLLSDWKYDDVPVVGQTGVTAKGSPSTSTRWVDGKAYITKVTGYDPSGKPLGTEVTLPDSEGALAGTYKFASTYKADGEIASSTVPAVGGLPQETLQYGYNDKDLPTTLSSELTSYVRSTSYTAFGEVSGLTVGATGGKSVSHLYDYEAGTRRLTRVTTSKEVAPARVSDVRYSYDDAGNIIKITDAPSSTTGEPTDNQCFTYDHLRRLTGAWTPANGDCAAAPNKDTLGGPAPYWHSWTFDLTGNRKSETRTSASGSTTATYAYPAAGQARPHAVQSVTTTGTGGAKTDTYQYDDSGNLTNRNLNGTAETFSWDGENELAEVTGGGKTTKYLNNADGDRLIRRDSSGVTLYLPGDTEVLLKPDGSLQGTRYYKHGEQTVAVRVGANQLSWLGADHHGTTTTAIDNTAQQNVQRRRLDPYGNVRGTAPTAWPGQRGFVGGTNDASTGLVHLGAREYDPTLGRFISVDPEANYQDPQTINGYSYSNNSPVTFTDPDGNSWFSNMVSSVTSSIKSVAETVVTRTVETVRNVVKTVTPVVNWVRDKVTQGIEAVRTFVHTVKEEIKKVVKTIAKVVVKKIQTFVKKVQVVAKKIASAAKTVAKKVVKNVQTAVKAVVDAAVAVGRGIKQFAQSELGKTILHAAASFATGFLASMAAVALCGPAALVCAAVGSAAFGGLIGGALHTGVDALAGEKISLASVGGHITSSMVPSAAAGVQRSVGATGFDVAKTVFRGGWQKLGNNFMKIGDPKNWRLPGMEPTKFLPK
ncbi:hypothetical protein OG394_07620 [Kribbella sp. NBC_01245]|uniref:RHS repeat domain-containing protein n=1 Tax=Kribbella sp. NBC_01245 TaxID=2903578 RepID=UPI002E295702|nr:RHS repeat-associated core domain-containing protein [Kribbella sp. NBC_01245]